MMRWLLAVGVVVLLAVGAASIVSAYRGHLAHQTSAHLVARLSGTDVWPAHMRPAPGFALRDQNGRLITRDSLRGRIWAVTFLDSRCTQQCPVAARSLATVQRMLGRHDPLNVIVVSVLPQYDTPARVRAFAHKSGLSGSWHWLMGSKRELAPVWRRYGILVVTGIEHTAALYLVDQRGDVRVADAVPFTPSQLAGSVRALTLRPASSG